MADTVTSDPTQALDASATDERVLLAWSVRLARRSPLRTAVAAGAVLLGAALGWALFRAPLVAVASGAVVFLSAAEYLLPIRCRLTTRRAVVAAGLDRQEIAWSSVRRVVPVAEGVLLSPLAEPGARDAFRGVFLRFADGEDRAAALAVVSDHVREAPADV